LVAFSLGVYGPSPTVMVVIVFVRFRAPLQMSNVFIIL
jgi:hypothetical protein